MAKIPTEQPLTPSVLDRLLDEDPSAKTELERSRSQVIRELKQSVRRDLENLLNTRRRCAPWPDELAELGQSLVNYGIADVTGADLGSAHAREAFLREVERVIRRFEPRFASVKVETLKNALPEDRTLRFRIDAMLRAEPAPEPVVFDSAMQPATGSVEVRGGRR